MPRHAEEVHTLLASKLPTYGDYAAIPVDPQADTAPFAYLSPHSNVVVERPVPQSLTNYTPERILVRSQVAVMLHAAGQALKHFNPALKLALVYGYRPLEEQQRLFDKAKAKLSASYRDETQLTMAAHHQIAVPEVAGHPTGGAVDVQVLHGNTPLDMGSRVWHFGSEAFTYWPFISPEAWANRQLLRRAMMSAGFAPFDGEWWHFSYGDKEWAHFYRRPFALYHQVNAADLAGRIEYSGPS
jgi:D-alanyl-D-alanine dipeptidase